MFLKLESESVWPTTHTKRKIYKVVFPNWRRQLLLKSTFYPRIHFKKESTDTTNKIVKKNPQNQAFGETWMEIGCCWFAFTPGKTTFFSFSFSFLHFQFGEMICNFANVRSWNRWRGLKSVWSLLILPQNSQSAHTLSQFAAIFHVAEKHEVMKQIWPVRMFRSRWKATLRGIRSVWERGCMWCSLLR